jgi:thiol-disulfide isomerase/thioredoxin
MENNIFQVTEEQHLDEILQNNAQKLTLIMYSSKTCGPCKLIKPKFVFLSKQNKDCFFAYIDINAFVSTTRKYIMNVECTPKFSYYFGGKEVASFNGAHEQALIDTLTLLKDKIEAKRKETLQKELLLSKQTQLEIENNHVMDNVNHNTDLMPKKIEILKKLRDLVQNGVILTKAYNLTSNYEEMLAEYELHVSANIPSENNKIQKIPQEMSNNVEPDTQNEEYKKQEQIKQIKELTKINQMMQMQQLYKLQQYKQLQKMKEQLEKKEIDRNEKKK